VDVAATGHSLSPSTIEGYRVVASNSAGTTEGPFFNTFTTLAASPPLIVSESVSHLTPTDATLEAQIDTEGQPTAYEFLMWYEPCAECEDFERFTIHLPFGVLLGSFVGQSVSLDLNSAGVTLSPGAAYHYSVRATGLSSGGITETKWQTFEPPPGVLDPPSPGASPLSGGGQPVVPSSGDQPAGPGSSSSSSLAPDVTPPISPLKKTFELRSLTNAQKLAKALNQCKKEAKHKRAACEKQAHKKYSSPGKKAK